MNKNIILIDLRTLTLKHIFELRNSSKIVRIGSHILFWVLFFASSFFLIKASFDPYKDTALSYLSPLRNTLGIALVYYPLMYHLIPQLLKERRWIRFIVYVSLLLIAYIVFEASGEKIVFYYCDECIVKAQEISPDYLSVIQKSLIDNILFKGSQIGLIFNLLSGLILPFAIKNSLGYYKVYAQNLQFTKDKVELELNFLKAQVNPHFLFNTLNNLYGSILKERTEQSAEIVTRLSSFMRYSLLNADRKSIPLNEEIDLINNYIELEKIRMNNTTLSFKCEIENKLHEIPPLLFIPLLENAFKYTTDKPEAQISITLEEREDKLHFTIQNNYNAEKQPDNIGGFGLSNLKKRLDLYYPEIHTLETSKTDSVFSAKLKFKLS